MSKAHRSCGRCGGINTTKEICPECGRLPTTSIVGKSAFVPLDEIPKYYQGKVWDAKVFWRYHQELKSDMQAQEFVSQLEKVYKLFASGKLPTRSAIISAPTTFSKLTWCYSCMQAALAFGYTVAPVLDTSELKRLVVLSTEKSYSYNEMSLDEYLSKDIVFVSVTKTEQRKGSASIIVDLLDKRARLGKPTFFISRYSIYELSYWDRVGDFAQIKSDEDSGDPLKIPAIITVV